LNPALLTGRRLAVLIAAALVVLLLLIAQLILPGLAADQLRDRLSKNGKVLDVEVSAFPAIELLWHQADKVVVRMESYRSTAGHLSSLLDQAADVGTLDASVASFDTGLLSLHDATLHKRGNTLTGSATVTEAALKAAVPFLDSVQPVASSGGQLTLRGTGTLLGVTASLDATVRAQNGALVVTPDVPFGGLATITVFHDPHVTVQSVAARAASGGFSVTAQAKLH
jgi:hypothetical protein